MERKFGPTDAQLRQQIQEADAETLLEWSERILTAETPEAVFHCLYNVGCGDAMSKAAFGLALADQLGLDASQAVVGRAADLALTARRPLDMRLDVQRFERDFGIKAPTMAETVKQVAGDDLESGIHANH